jgi:antitoxin (DNA-binding transcriptional repressor) of toxin-antitoxin stability system
MTTTFLDIPNKSGEIIRALKRNEKITVLYRGKPAAVIHPVDNADAGALPSTAARPHRVQDHVAFGLWATRQGLKDVPAHVRRLRRGRLDAL